MLEFKRFYNENLSKVSGGENLGILGPVYMTCWDRTLVCLIMFPIGRDKVRNAKIRAAFKGWVHLAAERGWAEYRAPAAFQDLVADTYSYNNHSLRRLRETIKDAVDPKGILSAGRYGVWPKHLRKPDMAASSSMGAHGAARADRRAALRAARQSRLRALVRALPRARSRASRHPIPAVQVRRASCRRCCWTVPI